MMTPVYLNPPPSPFPLVEEKEEQHLHLFLSSSNHQVASTSSLSAAPSFFNFTPQDHTVITKLDEEPNHHDHKLEKYMSHIGSSDRQVSSVSSLQPVEDDGRNIHNLLKNDDGEDGRDENQSSVKWMSSKMSLMQKMVTSITTSANDRPVKSMHEAHENYKSDSSTTTNNNHVRVCADCNTTTTPLWRSGPQGPKSLCNACGIRQRKARRAMAAAAAAAANGTVIAATEASSNKTKLHHKEKKSRTSHAAQHKKQHCKLPDYPRKTEKKKLCFKNLALSLSKNSTFQRVFPRDEEEAAILLMGLSCGFIYS